MMGSLRVNILRVLYLHFTLASLYAELPDPADQKIPDVPPFTLTYKGDALRCYPSSLVETKTKKNFVEFVCVQRNVANRLMINTDEVSSEEDRGREETKRLKQAIEDQKNVGPIYHVKIPEGDARYPGIASCDAKQILKNDHYIGKYIRWLLPAKFYIRLRPQFADMVGDKEGGEFRNAGSRAGFFIIIPSVTVSI